ncbi:hypothetical protein B0H14DRAFT_2566310 [Mycena olivaceomarginata]|nr:hypothetical protein B0H14DRAFT_2566310 [Mycena olivaceomarginata]
MSPTRRSGISEDVGFTLRWVRDMATEGNVGTERRRNSRSISPRDRLRLGPSHQITNFGRGEVLLDTANGKREFFVTDQVSEGEICSLCGFISRGDPAADLFLWPLPTWIEEESLHYHGTWTRGFFSFLENLTELQWRKFIKNGNKGALKAREVVPEDFDLGKHIVGAAFPVDWNKQRIGDIVLPESFSGALS